MRYCIDCNIIIGKGVKRCSMCKHNAKLLQNRSYYKTKFGVSLEVELSYINKWISEGNDTALKLSKKYNEVFGKSRSLNWLTTKLKNNGNYKLDRKQSIWERDKEHRKERENNANKWGFIVLSNTTRDNTILECKVCNTIQKYKNVKGRDGNCSICNRKQRSRKSIYHIRKKELPNYVSPHILKRLKVYEDIENRFINLDNSVTFKNKTEFNVYLSNKGAGANQWMIDYLKAFDGVNVDIQKEIKKMGDGVDTNIKYIDEINKIKGCSKCNCIKPFTDFSKSRSPFICNECSAQRTRELSKLNRSKNPSKYLASKLSLYIKEYAKHGWAKNTTRNLIDYLGIDVDSYKNYIESLWETGMSWDNTDEWHIDHIIPRSWFTQSDRNIKAALNWRNTRPEWKDKNLYKGWRFDANIEFHLISNEWINEFSDVMPADRIFELSSLMKQPGHMKVLKEIRNTYK